MEINEIVWTLAVLLTGGVSGYLVGLNHGHQAGSNIEKHHLLERELHRLRRLRDQGDPSFRPEAEDAVLDEMESIWNRLSAEDRDCLEVERPASMR